MTGPRSRSLVRLALAAALLLPLAARGEGFIQTAALHRSRMIEVDWEYSIPVMALRAGLVDAGSVSGVNLGVRFGVSRRLSLGAAFTWNGFQQTRDDVRSSFQALTARATLHWYLTGSAVQPYLGLFGGGSYLEMSQGAGPTQTAWAPCAGPEIGVLLSVADGLALVVAGRGQVEFTTMRVNGQDDRPVKWPSWASIQVGLGFY